MSGRAAIPLTTLPDIRYKPGWSFKLGGPARSMLCIMAHTVDSQNHQQHRHTQHMFTIPHPLTEREFARWVRDRLHDVEAHETCEFLTINGHAPFFPHHQDEGSPYEPVERWLP